MQYLSTVELSNMGTPRESIDVIPEAFHPPPVVDADNGTETDIRTSKEEEEIKIPTNVQQNLPETKDEPQNDEEGEETDSEDEYHHPVKVRTMRGRIFQFFEEPFSSAKCWAVFMIIVIITSVVNFLVGSMPQFYEKTPQVLAYIEFACVSVFFLEYVGRIATADKFWKWMIKPLNVIDLLCILPFIVEFFATTKKVNAMFSIRAIRTFRIFRIFRIGGMSGFMSVRYRTVISLILEVFSKTLAKSRDALLLFLFVVALFLLIFSTFMFYAEQAESWFDGMHWIRKDGEISPFQSVPHSFWWCIVTMTTVGYGDVYPISWEGKIVASLTMLSSFLFIAFPVSIIGANFSSTWYAHKQRLKVKRSQKLIAKAAIKKYGRGMKLRKILDQIARTHHELGVHISTLQIELISLTEKHNKVSELLELTHAAVKQYEKDSTNRRNKSVEINVTGRPSIAKERITTT